MATSAPSRAYATATARPMPESAPVMSATYMHERGVATVVVVAF